MSASTYPPGTAPVKPEYLISVQSVPIPDDDAAEGSTNHVKNGAGVRKNTDPGSLGPSRRKLSKEEKKLQRGANKGRRYGKVRDELELCWRVANGNTCEFGAECRFTHDIAAYLAAKPRDILFPSASSLTEFPPFVQTPHDSALNDSTAPTIDFNTVCPIFEETGHCKHGLKCRFLGGHAQTRDNDEIVLIVDKEKEQRDAIATTELNFVDANTLKLLRSRKYPRPISENYLRELQATDRKDKEDAVDPPPIPQDAGSDIIMKRTGSNNSTADTPDVPIRFPEKRRLNWAGKTYLAPLTTVGNLPFRRLCVDYGADITCGEMGLGTSFLAGSKEEWSLVRRHPSERTFGVQVAGNKPASLVAIAEVIGKECGGNIDFVDLNCGCPIDLVFRSGSGSALLDTPGKLGRILVGMNRALGEIPVTVKLRTGVKDGHNTAHKIMPRLSADWNAGCMTLHGRTRQQRYTKLADWDYIKQCVEAVRAREADGDLPRVPIFGGGDCYSSRDYWSCVEHSGVDGVMVGRGALIKPWIFTEMKEHREWDISSRERLDIIRKYAEFGLNHFGSDTAGVNTTRRYLCEALSFQYRYVPIGLLEVIPGRINDRAPAFRGRNELETLLASGDSRDWVKVSEMFLGPAPASWVFTPKHKSNTHNGEEAQG